jgi:hypothetical protein
MEKGTNKKCKFICACLAGQIKPGPGLCARTLAIMPKNKKTMKILLLILTAAFIATAVQSQTNQYFPFPDSNAVWCDSVCGVESYTLAGDTVIGTNTYHKLIRNSYYYQIGASGYCDYKYGWYQNNDYAGAIRQDIAQRKIYFLAASSTTDKLLCDFTLTVGDTIKTYNTEYHSNSIVTSVDSILIGTHYRKRWGINIPELSCGVSWNAQIIEGIGSTYGLLDQRVPHGFCQTYGKLYCFSQNNQTFYPYYSDAAGCSEITGITEILPINNQIIIYPNPFSTQTVLQTDNFFHNATLTVHNCFGKTVKQIRNISGQTVTLSRDNLPCGMYFVRLTEENKIFSVDKLVIVDN